MWHSFKALVQLCHASCYWEREKRQALMATPRQWSQPQESTRDFKRRRDEWKAEIRRREKHMHRAEYLADSAIAEMSFLISDADRGAPDWKLWHALRDAVRRQPQMRCKAAAFEAFDSERELEGELDQIAGRWLRAAGYSAEP